MKKRMPWSLKKKILLSIVSVLFLIVLSMGIQVAINLGIEPIPSSPEGDYDTGGGERLLNYYDLAYHGDGLPAEVELTETFVNSELEGALDFVEGRYDCADFRVNTLVRLYYDYEEYLPLSTKTALKETFLGFKYWMDQGGEDSMCYWSENHQILFATEEYLVGQMFPTEIFLVDGKTGAEHMEMAKNRVNAWMESRYKYGFTEWYSNNYYPEDIAPMSNFIQFATDPIMVNRMKMIMDLLWYDLASQSYKYVGSDAGGDPRTYYVFVSSSGRMYSDNRVSDDIGNRLRNYTDFVLQPSLTENFEGSWASSTNGFFNCFRQMMQAQDGQGHPFYTVPAVLKAVFDDPSEDKIIRSSQSLDVTELSSEGLIGQADVQIMMQLDMEAFTNPEVIDNSIEYIARNGMFRNEFLNDFKLINIWLLRGLHLLEGVSRLLKPSTDGVAIERANVYTFKTSRYSMSTAQGYHPGKYADQQALHQINLTNYLSVFTTQPAKIPRRSNTPTYWAGNGRNPYTVQERNVNLSIYLPPTEIGFMEPMIVEQTTHAFFPTQLFDEVDETHLEQGIIFGSADGAFIALIARHPLSFVAFSESMAEGNVDDMLKRGRAYTVLTEKYDLVQEGDGAHFFITELSSSDNETFSAFKTRILANPMTFDSVENSLMYTTVLEGMSLGTVLEASFGKSFSIDGTTIDLQYERHESEYVQNGATPRKASTIVFSFGGETLTLNYEENTRDEGN
jgi:hypothetical protein